MDIEKTISQMTLEEKASLCSGANSWETKAVERLGIPPVLMSDGPHGVRKQATSFDSVGLSTSVPATCFPPAALAACSFDSGLLREMGEALGEECVAEGVGVLLGPGTNIKRSPLCGRNFEYFSEDPALSGELAAALVEGIQSRGVGASVKHFAANNQETRRFSSDSRLDERTLHEIYLPAFKKIVQSARPATVMCSYNRVNGVYASEDPYLLTEVLRDGWGFDGLVVSDWYAANDRVKGLAAGMDLEMPYSGGANDRKIMEAVRAGILPMEALDRAVGRVLRLIERVSGEHTGVNEEHTGVNEEHGGVNEEHTGVSGEHGGVGGEHTGASGGAYDKDAHHELARRIACESMALLKNGGALPLREGQKIAVVGEFAERPRYQGSGSSLVNPTRLDAPLDAMRLHGDVTYCKGYRIDCCEAPDRALADEAVAAAKGADVCVVFAGLPPSYESEGFDRADMRMPRGQDELIGMLIQTGVPVAVVLQNGSPVEMPWAAQANAILEAYLGGQASGGAVADLLFGVANPCGKLAESFPKKLSDNPSYLSFPGEGDASEYREGIFVGYRYYDAKEMDVLFPFGHGLSYTRFEYGNLRLGSQRITDADTLDVSVDVTNVGPVAGKEIVQLYVAPKTKDDRVARPAKELRAFAKLGLMPGETKTARFTLDKSAFACYDPKAHGLRALPGVYGVMAARSSRDVALEAEVEVAGPAAHAPAARATVNTPIRDIMRMEKGPEFMRQMMSQFPDLQARLSDGGDGKNPLAAMFKKMLPEMLPRSLVMMGDGAFTIEMMQAALDKALN